MNRSLGVLSASIATFAATNIDDAFLLTLFFARRIPTRRIVAGQYAGFAAIIGLSLIVARGAFAIPRPWIHLAGAVPLAIGIRRLLWARRSDPEKLPPGEGSALSVALLTLSNGADNLSLYVPFFLVERDKLGVILISYAALVGLWCLLGRWLGNHSLILRPIDRWGHWALPLVFMGMGIYILRS